MILSRELYRPPTLFKKIWHRWRYRSIQRVGRVRKLMNWDELSFEFKPYIYSPRLALNPEAFGQMPKLRGDLCPSDAINWEKQEVVIDFSLCTRCHFCLESEPENFRSSHDLDHFHKT